MGQLGAAAGGREEQRRLGRMGRFVAALNIG
jgi:hypothetical protein